MDRARSCVAKGYMLETMQKITVRDTTEEEEAPKEEEDFSISKGKTVTQMLNRILNNFY